jgi:hypothetical protein
MDSPGFGRSAAGSVDGALGGGTNVDKKNLKPTCN